MAATPGPPLFGAVPVVRGNVGRALVLLNYPDPDDQEFLDGFADRWDGFLMPKLLCAIREAPVVDDRDVDDRGWACWIHEPEDRIFAIFAAGYSVDAGHLPAVRDTIAPYLASDSVHERWAAALVLGWQQDERAIPTLSEMLTEHLPPHLRYVAPDSPEMRLETWRHDIPRALARPWRRAGFVPALRGGLERLLPLLQAEPEDPHTIAPILCESLRRAWQTCCETIVFALGRLGAFSALDGLPLTDDERLRWRVHLAMGALHELYPGLHIAVWAERPAAHAACDTLLAQEYKMTSEERRYALHRYEEWYLQYSYRHWPCPWVEGWE